MFLFRVNAVKQPVGRVAFGEYGRSARQPLLYLCIMLGQLMCVCGTLGMPSRFPL